MSSPSSPTEAFDRLVADHCRAWFAFHPEEAVEVGAEGFAHLLPPYGDEDRKALLSLLDRLMADLEAFPAGELDPDRALDLEVLLGAAAVERAELLARDWRLEDPMAFLPVHAIYQLFVRPVEDFAAALRGRLSAIPSHLGGAKGYLGRAPERIPPLWLEAAVMEAGHGAAYLKSLRGEVPGMEGLFAEAARALEDFGGFLEGLAPRASGEVSWGRDLFQRRLKELHALDIAPESLKALGEQLFRETLRDLKDETRRLRGDEDIVAMAEELRSHHPSREGLLPAYRSAMEKAKAFVAEKGLVSLPLRESLEVVETPAFLRPQIPFAAYLEPSPRDPEQKGRYYVTPPESEEALGEHHYPGIYQTSVHEAWPGHHLQFVTAHTRRASSTLPRLLHPSATLYEGWALYCEAMMLEEGFALLPEQRFVMLRDRLWRALRILIDVGLHVEGMGAEAAIDRLVGVMGFPRPQAQGEITWYSRAPTVPMGYATGFALISALKDRLRAESPAFSLRAFHDQLLASGSIALPRVIRRQFGEERWRTVKGMVFA
ncbi:MAG: DUF885 domain-containing protein [Gammaproteobacteria bacterium]|nr:MAG: DUF885 domain-containing protein [Gammaproteobacteria bacterium]